MLDLFKMEAEAHVEALTSGLLALERTPDAAQYLESCMRAAHSLKGAARIVGLEPGVSIAHAMEDCFVGAQRGTLRLARAQIDILLRGVDLLSRIAEPNASPEETQLTIDAFLASLATSIDHPGPSSALSEVLPATPAAEPHGEQRTALKTEPHSSGVERSLRVSAENLNRLLGVAAESLIESRWLAPFAASLLQLKRQHGDTLKAFDRLRSALPPHACNPTAERALADLRLNVLESTTLLATHLAELESFDRRSTNVAHRLYDRALACRMQPFADGIGRFPRLVRDLAQALAKNARLEISGEATWLDREILARLEAPLGHLLNNALDHGIESPDERERAGKPAEAVVHLDASRSAGMLHVTLSDDGRGIAVEALRATVIARHLISAEDARSLSDTEIFQFLFLPGFSTKDDVSAISGRGVGLDVVYTMLKEVGGEVRVSSVFGEGTRFTLTLPLSLSVVRTLLAEVEGEPYAFPLAHVVRTLVLQQSQIESLEGRPFFDFDGVPVGLVNADEVLLDAPVRFLADRTCVIVLGEPGHLYGLVADRFIGERELVVAKLDVRLGKIKNVSAGALMEDGSPVLIIDVADMLRSIDAFVAGGRKRTRAIPMRETKRKRVLVVDDSLTVREAQRNLLHNAGYDVEVALNGMDGWNSVRTTRFDLLVTDVDMPRMDGIELVTLVKGDRHLKALPIIIMSYRDREEDRRRGLDAGADYFVSKGDFHDATLMRAVLDLIGAAAA